MNNSSAALGGIRPARPDGGSVARAAHGLPRLLPLGLAAAWLLDGLLQFQPYMFSKAFGQQTLATTALGNPRVIAEPISWAAGVVSHHPIVTNTAFALIQVLLGVGIAWPRSRKAALSLSIAWALTVWWIGEGLGGIFNETASTWTGSPGAVVLYALLAILIWPSDASGSGNGNPLVAERVGTVTARTLWLVLWGAEAYFALQPVNTSPDGLHDMLVGMASGEPGWLAATETYSAGLVAHHGLSVAVVLAVVLVSVALSVLLPVRYARLGVVVALALAAVIWLIGESLGGILTGQGTDPNSGPLLAMIALAYWPMGESKGAGAVQG